MKTHTFIINILICIPTVLFSIACNNNSNSSDRNGSNKSRLGGSGESAAIVAETNAENSTSIKYAKYFTIKEASAGTEQAGNDNLEIADKKSASESIKELVIKNTWNGEQKNDVYTLVPRDCTALLNGNVYAIPYPLKSVVCMSSSHVAYLTELGKESCIKGISGTRFISNEKVKQLIRQNKIIDVGGENLPNYELIMAMKPDVVLAYGINGSNNSHIEKLQKLGVRVLTIGDYLENSPLGKLEYLKLFGELSGKREMADSIFCSKEREYLQIKEKIAQAIDRGNTPVTKVLLNAPYKGTWYIPGNDNYIAQLIQDAGGEILGSINGSANSAQLSFEQGYQYALQAQIWLHPNAINTLKELEAEHTLFKNIPALKNGKVYNNTLRNTPEGGSDFWETGVVEPHIILQDLAYILNPQLFISAPELKYYRHLQ